MTTESAYVLGAYDSTDFGCVVVRIEPNSIVDFVNEANDFEWFYIFYLYYNCDNKYIIPPILLLLFVWKIVEGIYYRDSLLQWHFVWSQFLFL